MLDLPFYSLIQQKSTSPASSRGLQLPAPVLLNNALGEATIALPSVLIKKYKSPEMIRFPIVYPSFSL